MLKNINKVPAITVKEENATKNVPEKIKNRMAPITNRIVRNLKIFFRALDLKYHLKYVI